MRIARRSVLLAPAAALAACAAGDGRRVSLWAMDVEGANAKDLLPAFEAASGLEVDLQPLPWTAAHQKLLTAFAGGNLPDVAMISGGWASEFAAVGLSRPLPPEAGDLVTDQFAGVLDSLRIAGAVTAAPWTVDTAVQYYRRDLLARAGYEAPPTRLDEWRRMLATVKARSGAPYAVLMQLNWPDHLFALGAAMGASFLRDQQGRGAFSGPEFREALGLYVSLFSDGLAPRVTSIEASDPGGELARGFVAVHPSGAWTRADLNRRTNELSPERWSTAPMPGPDGPGASVAAASALLIPRSARRPERSLQLIRYFSRPDIQARFFELAGVLPSRPSAWRAPALTRDPKIAVFAGQLARARVMPTALEWPRIVTEVGAIAERVVRGRLTQAAAVAEMDRTADAILAKRRWLLERGRLS